MLWKMECVVFMYIVIFQLKLLIWPIFIHTSSSTMASQGKLPYSNIATQRTILISSIPFLTVAADKSHLTGYNCLNKNKSKSQY